MRREGGSGAARSRRGSLADVRIIEGLQRSAESGRMEELPALETDRRPRTAQAHRLPPVRKPRLVRARSGHRD